MTYVLGISAYYHDSAAALVVDGQVVAAAQEERFSRIKHDAAFPTLATEYCLNERGIGPDDLSAVAFYERPTWKFGRLVETHLASVPNQYRAFESAMSTWLGWKLSMASKLRQELRLPRRIPIAFCDHHLCHAASAFRLSPFDEAAIVTVDAVGEWTTTAIHRGRGSSIETLQSIAFPHSLGLLYSTLTSFAGFHVNDGEYKLMGLAPLGTPRFVDALLDNVIHLQMDGSFHIDSKFVDALSEKTLITPDLVRLLGSDPRRPSEPIRDIDRDIAASIQSITDLTLHRIVEHVKQLTGLRKVCFAGGVALNCASIGKLRRSNQAHDIWVQPAAGDSGCAIGAAIEYDRKDLVDDDAPALPSRRSIRFDPRLGPAYTDESIEAQLQLYGLRYISQMNFGELLNEAAQLIADGKVIAWFQGRMEFGPRALGSRSILADPRRQEMQSILNSRIKHREDFRPFAPAILRSHAAEWFDVDEDAEFPWMNSVVPVRENKRSLIPAVTHVDGSARLQTVDASMGRFYQLLVAFEALTGCPLLINTSFNDAGEPIVCTPGDAIRCFLDTRMDAMVIGNCLLFPCESETERTQVLDRLSGQPVPAAATLSALVRFQNRARKIAQPINHLLSRLALFGFYLVVFIPLGMLASLFGYDPLVRKIDRDRSSYWLDGGNVDSHEASRIGVVGEFVTFLREEKKWWLAPIFVVCLALLLLVAVSASPVAPFVYTLF